MKVLLHEGMDTTGVVGWYECVTELKPGMTVSVPGGTTYDINNAALNRTSGSGEPFDHLAIYCSRSSLPAHSPGVIPIVVSTECSVGDGLKQKYAVAAKASGSYAESLKGVGKTSEHRKESERLEKEATSARIAFTEHKDACPQCSRNRNST